MSERSWRLVVAAPAARGLERLSAKAAAAVIESLPAIATEPRRVGKPLRVELEGRWSARRGPYRVIYRIDEGERVVTVVAVGHRADVYRRR
ncbi:MAG: type II toxin-antitoxin system RelE family toxin [Gaiellaceae bacterium]